MQYSVFSIQSLCLLKKGVLKLFLLFILLSFVKVSAHFEFPKKPKVSEQHFVYDYTNLLSKRDSMNLNINLRRYSNLSFIHI